MVLTDLLAKIKSGELESDLAAAERDIAAMVNGQLDHAEQKLLKVLEVVRLFRDTVPELKAISGKISVLLNLFK